MTLWKDKFMLLMWKNFLLQWRHRTRTFFEIVTPILFALLLVAMRQVDLPQREEGKTYTTFDPSKDFELKSLVLYWSPTNEAIDSIMNGLVASLNTGGTVSKSSFKDSISLEEHLMSTVDTKNVTWGYGDVVAGIQFDDSLAQVTELPPNINVVIRFPAELAASREQVSVDFWNTYEVFPAIVQDVPRNNDQNDGGSPPYLSSGFLMIQKQLSYSIIKYLKKQVHKEDFNPASVNILMQRFPYGPFTADPLHDVFRYSTAPLIMFCFLYPCMNTVKVITLEKERQLKETMKIMGLPGWLHWTAWFIKSFTLFFIPIIFIVWFMTAKWYKQPDVAILSHSNRYVILLFFVCYACASISLCFALSSLFSKARTATIMASITWIAAYCPYGAKGAEIGGVSFVGKLFHCLLCNSAIAYGFDLIMMFESTEKGAQWENMWTSPSSGDPLALGHILLMLVIGFILFFCIALYVEAIFPGDYGVPQIWYFPFTRSYWTGISNNTTKTILAEKRNNKFFEKEPTNLEIGVKIQNLRKEFSGNVAVKNLTLNLYQDQITVLLGHNGAGKTTTMSMLTGMIPPTSGWATVAGHDLQSDLAGVRDSLGLCPQHDILFDDLTVQEHLYFYNRLKGQNKNEANEEIDKFLELLELTDKKNAKSSTLSGGMKRKLSVAIALCGNSKVVMCDEPSSGMDPSARRGLWDLLKSQKKGRTILLTTHFMDEADLLGDRIAIMFGGELQCCGSSYFLKKAYSAGYRLIMDINPECNINKVTGLLRRHIPDIKCKGMFPRTMITGASRLAPGLWRVETLKRVLEHVT